MSISSEISRINGNIADAYDAVGGKGGTLPSVQNSANLPAAIASIPSGGGTLITKTVTANGTYNASDDGADGYSSVSVDVSGGGGYEPGQVEFRSGITYRLNETWYDTFDDILDEIGHPSDLRGATIKPANRTEVGMMSIQNFTQGEIDGLSLDGLEIWFCEPSLFNNCVGNVRLKDILLHSQGSYIFSSNCKGAVRIDSLIIA